jgi:hypothetical protein
MNNAADVGLVDAHSKCNRRHNDLLKTSFQLSVFLLLVMLGLFLTILTFGLKPPGFRDGHNEMSRRLLSSSMPMTNATVDSMSCQRRFFPFSFGVNKFPFACSVHFPDVRHPGPWGSRNEYTTNVELLVSMPNATIATMTSQRISCQIFPLSFLVDTTPTVPGLPMQS